MLVNDKHRPTQMQLNKYKWRQKETENQRQQETSSRVFFSAIPRTSPYHAWNAATMNNASQFGGKHFLIKILILSKCTNHSK